MLTTQASKYDVELTNLKGKDNAIADALRWVSPLEPESEDKDTFGPHGNTGWSSI